VDELVPGPFVAVRLGHELQVIDNDAGQRFAPVHGSGEALDVGDGDAGAVVDEQRDVLP